MTSSPNHPRDTHNTPGNRKRVRAFCQQIGYSDPRYLNIDVLFVKPQHYDRIKATLDKHHIVCITGDPFMGKSYTALYLLYQMFTEGFQVQRPETRELNSVVTDLVYNLEDRLAGRRVIYIDDPFGQERYERLQPLTSDFLNLVHAVRNSDSRVIIISRSELFERGLGPLAKSEEIDDIRVQLRMAVGEAEEVVYSHEDLAEVMEKYISLYEPAWAGDPDLKQEIQAQALSTLHTPHSIEFFVSNYSQEVSRRKLTKAIQDSHSVNIIPAFAAEIAASSLSEIGIWLLFDTLLEDVTTLREIFESRISPALSQLPASTWDEYIRKHRGKFTEYSYAGKTFWKFYHPFLIEAISRAVGEYANVHGMLSLVYSALMDEDRPFILVDVAGAILKRSIAAAPAQLRLLDRLVIHDNYLVRTGVAAALVKYLVDVPGELRPSLEERLVQLAGDKDAWVSRNLAVAIAQNYDGVARVSPPVVRIFDDLSKHKDPNVRYATAEAVLWYYGDVPQLHPYLWRQAEDPDTLAKGLFADAIIWQFPVLSQKDQTRALDIIQRYASTQDAELRGWVQAAMAWHWDSLQALPAGVLENIWRSLETDAPQSYKAIADNLEWHHNYFAKYKPQFIGTLTSSAIRPTEYSGIMQTMFWGAERHVLPDHVQHYFVQLARSTDPRVRGWSAFAFSVRYSQFSSENRALLNELASDSSPETRRITAHCLAANYSRAEELIQNLLEHLARDPDPAVRHEVLNAIQSLGSEVPVNQRLRIESLAQP